MNLSHIIFFLLKTSPILIEETFLMSQIYMVRLYSLFFYTTYKTACKFLCIRTIIRNTDLGHFNTESLSNTVAVLVIGREYQESHCTSSHVDVADTVDQSRSTLWGHEQTRCSSGFLSTSRDDSLASVTTLSSESAKDRNKYSACPCCCVQLKTNCTWCIIQSLLPIDCTICLTVYPWS